MTTAAPIDGATPQLDFEIAFSDHRTARVKLSKYKVAAIAVDMAEILRTEAPSGAIGSPMELAAIVSTVHHFCNDLLAQTAGASPDDGPPVVAMSDFTRESSFADLRPHHVDGYEARLRRGEAHSMKGIHDKLFRLIGLLRLAGERRLLDASMEPRLWYVTLHQVGAVRVRDAFSPFIARQLVDAASKDVEAVIARHASDPDFEPGIEDALAFVVLLGLSTELPIECMKELKADCLEPTSTRRANLHYVKRRASKAPTLSVVRDAVGSPGWFIDRWLEASVHLRRRAPWPEGLFLFIAPMRGDGSVRRAGQTMYHVTADFSSRHAIEGDDGTPLGAFSLARLRKTAKAERYSDTLGRLKVFANDHSPRVAAIHYASIPSLLPLHEATIEAALREARRTASQVVATVSPAMPSVTTGVVALRPESDIFVATCTNEAASPHGITPGGNCSLPLWGCLDCRNARIAQAHLPAILCLLSFLVEKRSQMRLDDWAASMGRAFVLITRDILPGFRAEEVAAARAVAERDSPLGQLRLELATLAAR